MDLIYKSGEQAILSGALDKPIRAMLTVEGYQPKRDDRNVPEVRGIGYAPGGVLLANSRVESGIFKADDIYLQKASIAAGGVALLSFSGSLIAFIDFDVTIRSTNGPFEVKWDQAGILSLKAFR